MLSKSKQRFPKVDRLFPVHVQGLNGHTSSGSDAYDLGKIVTPGKMLVPNLGSRVEKQYCLPRQIVESMGMSVFVGIACWAGEGKVDAGVGASFCKRDNVFHRKLPSREISLIAAILTAPVCFGYDLPSKKCANHLLSEKCLTGSSLPGAIPFARRPIHPAIEAAVHRIFQVDAPSAAVRGVLPKKASLGGVFHQAL